MILLSIDANQVILTAGSVLPAEVRSGKEVTL